MKGLKIAVLGAALAAPAGPLLAGPRLCSSGLPPTLSGDAFAPVECSATAKPAAFLPGLPARRDKAAKADLRDLDGRWEGILIHALGRYELLLTIKTSWRGKTELTLDTKELQFRERLTDRLLLSPAKERGAYEAVMTTSLAPEASLSGRALVGAAAGPEVSTAAALSDRQADLTFANGAAHRIVFALAGKDELRVRAFSAVPGAPLQKFETTLARTKREGL